MADEGYYYESRCVCKLCNKKFPCGKSLGAHMRSHVAPPPPGSAESDEKPDFEDFVQESDSRINYGLRENPKKTWRAENSSTIPSPPPPPPPQGRICKQCGKGFQSMKALCGHMACHSEKERNVRDDSSWTSENQKAAAALEYSCSDSEEAEGNRMRTRSSKNKRYKKFVEKSPLFLLSSDGNLNNGSSSVSEIDGQDQEEVAMCLMLLSRDFVNCNNNNNNNHSIVESSDNNSVILETNKSSSVEKRVGSSKGKKSTSEDGGISDSDSGYFLDECAKAESGLSVEGFRRYSASFFGDLRSGGSDKDQFRDESRKYECYNCKKAFKSYQALGGHRPCHKRTASAVYEPRYESGENSLDDSTDYNRKKTSSKKNKATATATNSNKSKSHICPFCDRVFKNGQALGGHKRSHFIGGGNLENRSQARLKGRDMLDLNLPAPESDGF